MSERGGFGVLALAATAAAVHAITFREAGPVDDELIIWRYARNLVEGHGLVFNTGELVEGYSAPLWVLTIAGALALALPPKAVGFTLGLLSSALATAATGLAWRRLRPGTQWFAPALLVAASPSVAWHAVAGLGTVPMAALIAIWLWLWIDAFQREEPAWGAAVALGLAGLMRAEALILAVPFAVVELRRNRALAVSLAFAPALAWLAFRLVYYGRWLPVTYHVKQLPLLAELKFGVVYLGVCTLTTGIGVLLFLTLPLFLQPKPSSETPLRAAAVGLGLFVAYVVSVGGDFMELARFFVPVLPLALVLACAGFQRIAGPRPKLLATAMVASLIAMQWPQFFDRRGLHERHVAFEERWEHVATELKRRVEPGTRIATSPIGALGWYTGLPIVDMLGLTNDAIWRSPPDLNIVEKGHHRYDAEWVLSQSPDLVVLGNAVLTPGADGTPQLVLSAWERTLWEHPEFQRGYTPLMLDLDEGAPLLFHLRNGAKAPEGARRP